MLERKLREPFQSVFLLWSSLLWQHLSAVHLAFWAHTALHHGGHLWKIS